MAIATAKATFTGAEDSIAVTYANITTAVPTVICSDAIVTDGSPAPVISVQGAPTNTGCTVATSARFSGTVTILVLD